jgi:hypothetical protein
MGVGTAKAEGTDSRQGRFGGVGPGFQGLGKAEPELVEGNVRIGSLEVEAGWNLLVL